MTTKAHILIVEDNADLAYGLRNNLEIDGHAVTTVDTGEQAIDAVRHRRPDLIVLDLMLPGLDGYQVLRRVRADGHDMPVLILSARTQETDKVMGFRLGADDYVTKPFGVLEVLARVGALLRRASRYAALSAVERIGDIEINQDARVATRNGVAVDLAPMEYALLMALVARRGGTASRLELLRDVWGHSAAVVTRTVDTHIAELRRKLEADPAHPVHILTVRKVGYRVAGGPPAASRLEPEQM
jgi:two-component system alkaline phosphatase synthesis response regulator PhoP